MAESGGHAEENTKERVGRGGAGGAAECHQYLDLDHKESSKIHEAVEEGNVDTDTNASAIKRSRTMPQVEPENPNLVLKRSFTMPQVISGGNRRTGLVESSSGDIFVTNSGKQTLVKQLDNSKQSMDKDKAGPGAGRPQRQPLLPPKTPEVMRKPPSVIRKPIPVNEPKPVLPASKQIKGPLIKLPHPNMGFPLQENLRNSVIEEENSGEDVSDRGKMSKEVTPEVSGFEPEIGIKIEPLIECIEENEYENEAALRMCKSSKSDGDAGNANIQNNFKDEKCDSPFLGSGAHPCKTSPEMGARARPGTLQLGRKEHVGSSKRSSKSSSSSMTPSTESSQCSKVFDFPEDQEHRDRVLEEAIQEEESFLAYVETLQIDIDPVELATSPSPSLMDNLEASPRSQRQRTASRSSSCPKVGMEHLDHLCKMMEELTVLRDQNTKLQRRLNHLEVVTSKTRLQSSNNNLEATMRGSSNFADRFTRHGSHSEVVGHQLSINNGVSRRHGSVDSLNREAAIGWKGRGSWQEGPWRGRGQEEGGPWRGRGQEDGVWRGRGQNRSHGSVESLGRGLAMGRWEEHRSREERSRSVGTESHTSDKLPKLEEVSSPTTKTKMSKWSKVKEALRWEKPPSELLTPPTPRGFLVKGEVDPGEDEITKNRFTFLTSSSSSEDLPNELYNLDDNPIDFGLQRSSSVSDCLTVGVTSIGIPRRHSLTSVQEKPNAGISVSPEDKKESKSAWGKVKNMIYTRRSSLKTKHRKSHSSDILRTDIDSTRLSLSLASDEGEFLYDEDEGGSMSQLWMHDWVSPPHTTPTSAWTSPSHTTSAWTSPPHTTSAHRLSQGNWQHKDQLAREHGFTSRDSSTEPPDQQTLQGGRLGRPPDQKEKEDRPEGADRRQSKATNNQTDFRQKNPPKPGEEVTKKRHRGASLPGHTSRRKFKWNKVKRAFLTPIPKRDEDETSQSLPSSPNRANNSRVFFFDDHLLLDNQPAVTATQVIHETESTTRLHEAESTTRLQTSVSNEMFSVQNEIQRNYQQLQRSLSQEFHKKMSVWERQRQKTSRESKAGIPAGGGAAVDESQLPKDFRRKLDEWEKMKGSVEPTPGGAKSLEESGARHKIRARPTGQQKIQEGDLKPEFKLKVAEWEVRKALAGHSSKTAEEITKMMPDDFNKKLKEWEQIKDRPAVTSPQVDRKVKAQGKSKKKRRREDKWPRDGGATTAGPEIGLDFRGGGEAGEWLDKELQKIQREKQRLEREKAKYLEREERLGAMREALIQQSPPRKQITVKTSKGEEFRFEGISQKFTKKLYEWESRRGIAPESSTIALLHPNNQQPTHQEKSGKSPEVVKHIVSGISRSKSEGSLAEVSPTLTSQSLSNLEYRDPVSRGGSEGANIEVTRSSPQLAAPRSRVHSNSRDVEQITRRGSLETQSSIQLLDEKMGLLGRLQEGADETRDLETQLKQVTSKLEEIDKSRNEYDDAEVREQEQRDLILAADQIKSLLEDRRKNQALITRQLITKIDTFNSTNLAGLCSMDSQDGSSFPGGIPPIKRVQKLSMDLERNAKKLEKFLHERDAEIAALRTQLTGDLGGEQEPSSSQQDPSSPECEKDASSLVADRQSNKQRKDTVISGDIPRSLFETIRLLKEEMTALSLIQDINEKEARDRGISPSRTCTPPQSAIFYSDAEDFGSREYRSRFSLRQSFSDSDLNSCEEGPSTRFLELTEQPGHLASQASSTNSMSYYGSESAIDIYVNNDMIHHTIKVEAASTDSEDNDEEEVDVWDECFQNEFDKRKSSMSTSDEIPPTMRFRKKTRRTSSENISTPTSGRSRSPSLISSDEQEELEGVVEEAGKENVEDGDTANPETEIDKVFRLVQDLKQKDLEEHKRKIEEKRLRLENIEIKSDTAENYKSDETNSENSSKTGAENKKGIKDGEKLGEEDKIYQARLVFSKAEDNSKTSVVREFKPSQR